MLRHGRSASKTPLVTGLPTALLWSRLSTLCTFMASSCIFSSSSPFFAGDTAGGNACALPPSHVLLGLGCALSIERRLWPPCMVGSRASSQCLIKWCAGDRCSPDSLASPSRSPPPSGAFIAFCGVFLWCVSGLLHPPSHMWCAAPARPAWSAAWLLASLCLALSSLIDGMLRCAALRPTKRALLEEPQAQKASALSRCCVGRCARCARCPRRMDEISPRELRIQMSKYSSKYSCPEANTQYLMSQYSCPGANTLEKKANTRVFAPSI